VRLVKVVQFSGIFPTLIKYVALLLKVTHIDEIKKGNLVPGPNLGTNQGRRKNGTRTGRRKSTILIIFFKISNETSLFMRCWIPKCLMYKAYGL
jgi:hypothetical protein